MSWLVRLNIWNILIFRSNRGKMKCLLQTQSGGEVYCIIDNLDWRTFSREIWKQSKDDGWRVDVSTQIAFEGLRIRIRRLWLASSSAWNLWKASVELNSLRDKYWLLDSQVSETYKRKRIGMVNRGTINAYFLITCKVLLKWDRQPRKLKEQNA